jgi:L-ascorbate metabolism protein UlaG (beta-lactamase superfamily)
MRLTKLGHACVRLEKDGRILVIDPGALTEPEALDGAEAVLITHEHFDHFDVTPLKVAAGRTPQLHIWTTSAVADQLGGADARVHAVGEGESFEAAGFDVGVFGEVHAVGNPAWPRVANVGSSSTGERSIRATRTPCQRPTWRRSCSRPTLLG